MKKVSILFCFMLVIVAMSSIAQAPAPADFFAGKWDILVAGTPNGDTQLVANLVRKDGKLTGEITTPADTTKGAIPITKIEEGTDKLALYFTAQGYDVNLDLAKIDDDNLKGSLMNMFDAKAKRLK